MRCPVWFPACLAALVLARGLDAAPVAGPRTRTPRTRPTNESAVTQPALTTEQLAARTRPSLAVISNRGRDGSDGGVGTGFVIDANGLVATSLHVVGEARPLDVRLSDGRTLPVIAVHAFDRHADLAILRVDATNLVALPLGDSSALAAGAEIVAMGNPMGMENSVVAGVLSARRTMDGIEMLQVAMPIEPGNSGGPVIDRLGRVQGIVNAKSLLTRNLGFATPANLLKPLLEKPNPVPIASWIRAGALDPAEWEAHHGASWRAKPGRILVDGTGSGFGGRAFLLHRHPAPEPPFELSVSVKLDDESGAAGLVFLGDDDDRHYGFYPTGGQLRLTAFEGADVFSWRILGTVPSAAYRRGEWNQLRVRVETNRIVCLVNDQTVFTSTDRALRGKRVGIAKFRETSAQFRGFAAGRELPVPPPLAPGLVAALGGGGDAPEARLSSEDIASLRANLPAARAFLAERTRRLERESARLRDLASRLHRDSVRDELVAELARPGGADLARAALLVARHDQPELEIEPYLRRLDALAGEAKSRWPADAGAAVRLDALRTLLFSENGFHGSRHDYYNRANSRLSDVIDDREGLPITLAVLFMEVARRAGIEHVHGVPLPGHFLVKHAPPGGDERLLDVFDGGRYITHSEADELGSEYAGVPVRSEFLPAATPRDIIVRMLANLQAFTEREEGAAASLRYADLLVAVAGEARAEANHRIDRARLRAQCGDLEGSRADLKWILDTAPPGIDAERIAETYRRLRDE